MSQTFPDWQKKIREAQAIDRARNAEIAAKEEAERRTKAAKQNYELVKMLEYLGIDPRLGIHPVDDNGQEQFNELKIDQWIFSTTYIRNGKNPTEMTPDGAREKVCISMCIHRDCSELPPRKYGDDYYGVTQRLNHGWCGEADRAECQTSLAYKLDETEAAYQTAVHQVQMEQVAEVRREEEPLDDPEATAYIQATISQAKAGKLGEVGTALYSIALLLLRLEQLLDNQ